MVLDGCQGQAKTPTMMEIKCPQCGGIIEVFSRDETVTCDSCGYVYHNEVPDALLSAQAGQDAASTQKREQFIEDALKF